MKMRKRLSALAVGLLALVLSCAATAPAYAHEAVDMGRTGSISAEVSYDGSPVGGGSLTLYRVGAVAQDDGNFSFALTDDFAGSGLALDDVEDAALAQDLAAYAADNGLAGQTVAIGSDGSVSVSGLELGLYLVVQDEAADGFEPIAPFLVSVPLYDAATGAYQYHVTATPKMETLTPAPEEPVTPGEPAQPAQPAEPVGETPTAGTTAVTETKLPQTGTLAWLVPVLAVSGVVIFLAGGALVGGKQAEARAA